MTGEKWGDEAAKVGRRREVGDLYRDKVLQHQSPRQLGDDASAETVESGLFEQCKSA
jgi:hypothetical protein